MEVLALGAAELAALCFRLRSRPGLFLYRTRNILALLTNARRVGSLLQSRE